MSMRLLSSIAEDTTGQATDAHDGEIIFVVDDDGRLRNLLCEVLTEEHPGFRIVGCATSQQALNAAVQNRPILMLTDYHLHGSSLDGVALFDELHRDQGMKPIRTIMVSSDLPGEKIQSRGIIGIEKPFDLDLLLERVATELYAVG